MKGGRVNMKDEQFNGDEDYEEELREIEDEIEEEVPKPIGKKVVKTRPIVRQKEVKELYEAFSQPSKSGVVNTLTGEIIDGFDGEYDKGHILVYKMILNKLDKIGIACGA